ncbi:RdRP-domain-containing protein [Wolfiporia cocos MD-104 SS10]|uniref:RNA-dependent RNA polymerase n=1 Tax=Wolfiporia cocos (strain MD-104) TaxID=742152 RepID=A0A2H3JV66_WOLCO|nr:RdRP-domain-containing protein [Wolfiporia cocos MD-104 SS10]
MLKTPPTTITTAKLSRTGSEIVAVNPQERPSSRATRIVNDSQRFLVVSVPKKGIKDTLLRQTLLQWTCHGLSLHGKLYTFLGFSDNDIKSGRVIFFLEDETWNVQRLLRYFGHLEPVFTGFGYGKYAARLGMSFSSTMESLDVPADRALKIVDWVASDGSIHTDGCGMIRDSFAREVCRHNGLPLDTSVFQIRRGGIKGLLVRYPDEQFDRLCVAASYPTQRPTRNDARVQYDIAYRPTMLKYDGGPTHLEINSYSHSPGIARLNSDFILLLSTLNVPLSAFEKMLRDQLDTIDYILHDRDIAERYVKGELDASDTKTYNQDLFGLLLAKHDLAEPYVQWRLKQFQRQQYETLRKKLNIRVEDSCYVYGVADEEGVLEEDEVFVNLPGRGGPLTQRVVVARNPSHYPGDMRVFHAVNYEKLRHLRNCIVFSRKASYSVPDSMASGDLDGDQYFVTWESSGLVPQDSSAFHRRPRNPIESQPRRSARRTEDMSEAAVDTFMDYKFSTLLGRMSMAWKKAAEATPYLANHPRAKALVPLIEAALDGMKAGIDVKSLEKDFHKIEKQFPILNEGQSINPLDALREIIPQRRSITQASFECDPSLILKDSAAEAPAEWSEFIAEAESVMPQFNRSLAGAISLDKQSVQEDDDYADISSNRSTRNIVRQADRIKEEFRDRYFGGGSFPEMFKQRLRASAWYWYGYSRQKQAFAWLGERYLNEIKACHSNGMKPILYVGSSHALPTHPLSPSVAATTTPAVTVPEAASQNLYTESHIGPDTDSELPTPSTVDASSEEAAPPSHWNAPISDQTTLSISRGPLSFLAWVRSKVPGVLGIRSVSSSSSSNVASSSAQEPPSTPESAASAADPSTPSPATEVVRRPFVISQGSGPASVSNSVVAPTTLELVPASHAEPGSQYISLYSDDTDPATSVKILSFNPRPRAPVAQWTNMPFCTGREHKWSPAPGCNGRVRRYYCSQCVVVVKEKKAVNESQEQVWVPNGWEPRRP